MARGLEKDQFTVRDVVVDIASHRFGRDDIVAPDGPRKGEASPARLRRGRGAPFVRLARLVCRLRRREHDLHAADARRRRSLLAFGLEQLSG